LCIGLTGDRDRVYARINARVDTMIQAGLEAEARSILSFPNLSLTARQAIGYKEFIPYFEQKATLDDVKETIKQASRRYAKRQFTWFHNQFDVMWFDAFDEDMEQKVQKEVEVFIRE
jgi:tRNA dimethylallyltransferase